MHMPDSSPMKAYLCILLCICCLYMLGPMQVYAGVAGLSQALSSMKITLPRARLSAPNFTLPDLKQANVRLSDYRGKLVLLNFWASFCVPCRKEMPALEDLWQRYHDKGLVILALSADRDNLKRVEMFINEGHYSFPILLDTAGVVRKNYEIRALPTSYLIGRDGKFIGRVIGGRDWDGTQGRKMIELLLSR